MAREMTKKTKRFSLEESDAIEENERILESGSQQRKENRENKKEKTDPVHASGESKPTISTNVPSTPIVEQSVSTYSSDIMKNVRKPNGKKTENGITIYVPMEYYEQIVMMKMRTGIPIKDLALRAVIDFLDRIKME